MNEKYLISKNDLEQILMKLEDYSISLETVKLLLKKLAPFINIQKKSIDELANKICAELPENYEIIVYFENGYGGIDLKHNGCTSGKEYTGTIEEQIVEALADAKIKN